jgi:hypothetical protein
MLADLYTSSQQSLERIKIQLLRQIEDIDTALDALRAAHGRAFSGGSTGSAVPNDDLDVFQTEDI